MKKIIFLFAIIFCSLTNVYSQTSFSCTAREYCIWDEYSKEFVDCERYAENSLFVVNANETIITHTIDDMQSSYYVTSREYDEKKDVWSYYVTSDVGNKYLYVFDPKNKQIRTLLSKDDKTILLIFRVKAIF
jgi:hypothetical protein